jgi:hypothetical protein
LILANSRAPSRDAAISLSKFEKRAFQRDESDWH